VRPLRHQTTVLIQHKKRDYLSPALAGEFAIDLGEIAKQWMITAALETERDSPINQRLRKR
jgi:hypothetical protein